MATDPQRTPIEWTDADLDALSTITPQDTEEARAWWKRNADPQYRELLDAEPVSGADAPTA